MASLTYKRTSICGFLLAVGLSTLLSTVTVLADDFETGPGSPDRSDRPGWKFEPVGGAWGEFYAPHDSNTFMYTGTESAIRLYGTSRFEFYFFGHMSTYAGYRVSSHGSGPRTPVDLLHQRWVQALGLSYHWVVPLHLYLLRDCNHMLDGLEGGPYLWTDAVLGVGTYPPFRRLFLKDDSSQTDLLFKWFLGGGPTIRTQNGSIWDYNSNVTSESWGRGFVQKRLTNWLAADGFAEVSVQGATVEPKVRHRIQTEIGITLHSGAGGWRAYFGRRWRDTTYLWPSDQRNYYGFGYVF